MKRSFAPPEVLQSSALDCGPAALMAVLAGFGVHVSYEQLRGACQTSVDGTSIDVLQTVARQLGLSARQRVWAADMLLEPRAGALPAIAVMQLPDLRLHFVVLWRRIGPFVLAMDPGVGRRVLHVSELARLLYVHTLSVPAKAYQLVAAQPALRSALSARLERCGVKDAERRLAAAFASGDAAELAGLDAAARLLSALRRARSLGGDVPRLLEGLLRVEGGAQQPYGAVPESFWSATARRGADGSDVVQVRGAVLLSFERTGEPAPAEAVEDGLSVEELAGIRASGPRPLSSLLDYLRADGLLQPLLLFLCALLAAGGTLVEALLLRGALEVGRQLGLVQQRAAALAALWSFACALLLLEYPIARLTARLGQRLDARVRVALLTSLGQLDASYFGSRAASDIAARAHAVHRLRALPAVATRLVRGGAELVATCVGLVWLAPFSAPLVAAAVAGSLAVPFFTQLPLRERDARVREHDAARSRLYLDTLLGLVAIRAHGGERALRGEHDALTAAWATATRSLARVALWADGLSTLVGATFSVLLLHACLARGQGVGSLLLLLYWGLSVPPLAHELVVSARQYPGLRNIALRVLEPIAVAGRAPRAPAPPAPEQAAAPRGVRLRFSGARVVLSGHPLLLPLDLQIERGEHVAVVGASGAGKSSLLGLTLGLLPCAGGEVLVDDAPLAEAIAQGFRESTAWVDPSNQLWNRSLLDNLAYGAGARPVPLPRLLESAELIGLLEGLPRGLQEPLGEGGVLVSGGEGQRVRFGRALARPDARLVLLDEPFRGLDQARRERLMTRARAYWSTATMLCVTHDVTQTLAFPRVLVIEGGRVVEDGAPRELAARGGAYAGLLAAHTALGERVWAASHWRHASLERGRLVVGASGEGV
jgi:ABC-type bacteriocin/lantibiotic exporter with double-glycine peptidase domain